MCIVTYVCVCHTHVNSSSNCCLIKYDQFYCSTCLCVAVAGACTLARPDSGAGGGNTGKKTNCLQYIGIQNQLVW